MKKFQKIMLAIASCLCIIVCAGACAQSVPSANAATIAHIDYENAIYGDAIYGDVVDNRCFYERMVVLPNGNLLATWQRSFPLVTEWRGMRSFYFYESADLGKTWTQVSELDASDFPGLSKDKVGMCGLYVFPQDLGDFSAGTILFATSDWDATAEYCIHIWRSEDSGRTWTHHSDLAPRNGAKRSIWEPEFAISSDGRLVCYYSDERQAGYDQCLAQEISTDGGVTWTDYTIIVGKGSPNWIPGVSASVWRPGMPRVTRLPDGTYFLAYENISGGYNGIVSCRTSADGIHWGDPTEMGVPVMTVDGAACYQCPMIACVDDGSTYGRLFLRGMNDTCSPSMCFTSTDAGQTWSLIDAPLTAVRDESVGCGWSGTFVAVGNQLIELNNYYNGAFNEIRCGYGLLSGNQLFVSGADYKFVNQATGYCVDDAGGSMDQGNELIVWSDNGLDTQRWQVNRTADTNFALTCRFSGLALGNPSSSKNSGTRMIQWELNGSPAQNWSFIPDERGGYRIQNEASELYLDTERQSLEEHANLIQNDLNDSLTQSWHIERIYSIARFRSSNISDCHIYHDADGRVLIVNASSPYALTQSQWRMVPGLANAEEITFESVDMPGYYLRHKNGEVIISQDDGSDIFKSDATWIIHESLDHRGGVSFEASNIPGAYMRHYNSYLIISEISTSLDKQDASFIMIVQ